MIEDIDIPFANPADIITQYEPFIKKLANRYVAILQRTGSIGMDDLIQIGRIAVIDAQSKYDSNKGCFINWLSYYCKKSMRNALGYNSHTGEEPEPLIYLDEPIISGDGNEISRIDLIQDQEIMPFDESIIADETRKETIVEVHAAVNRLKSEKQREVIKKVWLEGQTRKNAAEEMGMDHNSINSIDKAGRYNLFKDQRLRSYAMPSFHISASRFNTTWTSDVEAAVIWREEHSKKASE